MSSMALSLDAIDTTPAAVCIIVANHRLRTLVVVHFVIYLRIVSTAKQRFEKRLTDESLRPMIHHRSYQQQYLF